MKTKKLIQLLQEADPTGELECCVGTTTDIRYVDVLPAYYDGRLQVLKVNEKNQVIGAKYVREGSKVCIHTLSISDAVIDCELSEEDIDYSQLSKEEVTKKAHKELRDWYMQMCTELEMENFQAWAKDRAEKLTEDIENIKDLAFEAFKKFGLSRDDKIVVPLGKSYNETRFDQWNEKFEVVLENGFLVIKEKVKC